MSKEELKELEEDFKDYKEVYERDLKDLAIEKEYAAKSELAYLKARIKYLEANQKLEMGGAKGKG